MREEFEKLVAAGKLARHHMEALVQLASSGYCYHRSWGFGKITTVDTVFARFSIDFQNKPGHQMDLGFAKTGDYNSLDLAHRGSLRARRTTLRPYRLPCDRHSARSPRRTDLEST